MIYKLIILDLAIEDAQDAFNYYEKHQVNLGFRFEDELANLIDIFIKILCILKSLNKIIDKQYWIIFLT